MNTGIDWQGHRGCRGELPENTIISFLKAIDYGVSSIEMDVVITGDGRVLVSHEPYFSSKISTPPDGIEINEENEKSFNIFQMHYDDIKTWDVGLKKHPDFKDQKNTKAYKPLLSDVIETVENYLNKNNLPRIYYSIEIKSFKETEGTFHPNPKVFAKSVLDIVKKFKVEEHTIIQAFDERIIHEVKNLLPNIRCSFLYQDNEEGMFEALDKLSVSAEIFGPSHELVTPELVSYCTERNMKIIPWTVNDRDRIIELLEMGVQGIISDFPNWIQFFRDYFNDEEFVVQPSF